MDIKLVEQLQQLDETKPLVDRSLLKTFQKHIPTVTGVVIAPEGYLTVTSSGGEDLHWLSPISFKGLLYTLDPSTSGLTVRYVRKLTYTPPVGIEKSLPKGDQ
jgi:hypothetical protein